MYRDDGLNQLWFSIITKIFIAKNKRETFIAVCDRRMLSFVRR